MKACACSKEIHTKVFSTNGAPCLQLSRWCKIYFDWDYIEPTNKSEVNERHFYVFNLKNIFIYLTAPGLSVACGIYFPDQGSNLGSLLWEHGVVSTGQPGKSPNIFLTKPLSRGSEQE